RCPAASSDRARLARAFAQPASCGRRAHLVRRELRGGLEQKLVRSTARRSRSPRASCARALSILHTCYACAARHSSSNRAALPATECSVGVHPMVRARGLLTI